MDNIPEARVIGRTSESASSDSQKHSCRWLLVNPCAIEFKRKTNKQINRFYNAEVDRPTKGTGTCRGQ